MPRGEASPVGTRRITQNGYWTTKTENGWRLDHHIIAEEKLGRALEDDERVEFIDGDRTNLKPKNIRIVFVGQRRTPYEKARKRLLRIEAWKERLDHEISELKIELDELDPSRSNKSLTESNE